MNPFQQFASRLRPRNQLLKTRAYAFTAHKTITRPAFIRTMASNASNVNPEVESEPTNDQQTSQSQQDPSDVQATTQHAPLPLPEPNSDTTQLNVNGEGVKLDHLGPLVVNKDGSLSRIANWDKMAEIEKQNTLRILGKRNQLRLGNLKGEAEGKEGN